MQIRVSKFELPDAGKRRLPRARLPTVGLGRWRRTLTCMVVLWSAAQELAGAESPYVTVQEQALTERIEAYAQVQPIAAVPLKAPTPGILADFAVLPGATVAAGETLARLTGPEVKAATAKAQAAVEGATARLASAQQTLAVLQPQLSAHLSTQQQVAQAMADVADARGALATARADLEVANWTATIRTPVAGTVLAVSAASGEHVAAGDTLLTLEPANGLWVTAVLYGAEAQAVRMGERGTFTPSDARAAIQVEVASLAVAPGNGGLTVGMRAADPKPDWRNGEYGRVGLSGAKLHLVAVPTQALILDQGKWWVLVHTAQGNQPMEVVPGPARGWQTLLRRGPAPDTQIVAQNAYLEYHRQISTRYQPPD